jgi:hypothetical protein
MALWPMGLKLRGMAGIIGTEPALPMLDPSVNSKGPRFRAGGFSPSKLRPELKPRQARSLPIHIGGECVAWSWAILRYAGASCN